jgi:hypothetical protein
MYYKYISVLKMGADFYIYVYLEIEHINGTSYYEFDTERGYYCDCDCGRCDSDVEDENDQYYNTPAYKELYENMKKMCLTPNKPLVVYNNNTFVSSKLETKYLPFIQEKLKQKRVKYVRYTDTGVFTSIDQIIKITKKEERYDPYDAQ